MKKISIPVYFTAILFLFFTACSTDGFKQKEVERIYSGDKNAIMSLFTVDNVADSLLLRQNARQIKKKHLLSESVQLLKERMLVTVNDPENPGVGIAAPQVGVSVRMFYVQRLDKENEPFEVYYNPEIVEYGDNLKLGAEGCLSVPDFRGEVKRAQSIVLSYNDSLGQKVTEKINGFTAVIFQHEVDHINGILYYDRIVEGYEALIKEVE